MKIKVLLAVCAALALGGCGPGSSEESVGMRQPELAGRDRAEALVISPRTYTTGTVTVKVRGFFDADGSQALNLPASITDEEQTWLQFGDSGSAELNVLFTNSQSMAEHGVTIGVGPYTVTTTSTSGECEAEVDVTPVLITGRYSCSGSTGYNNQTREMGEVDVEVEFSAGS